LFVPFTFLFFFPSWRFKMTVGARLFLSGIVDSCVDHFFLLVVLSSSSFFSDVLPSSRPWFIAPFENRECEGRKPLVRRSTTTTTTSITRIYYYHWLVFFIVLYLFFDPYDALADGWWSCLAIYWVGVEVGLATYSLWRFFCAPFLFANQRQTI
jgi:hypothetical protein